MANERDEEAPVSTRTEGTAQPEPGRVTWLCNCGTTTFAVRIERPGWYRRGWYTVDAHDMPPGGRCPAPPERYGNKKHFPVEAERVEVIAQERARLMEMEAKEKISKQLHDEQPLFSDKVLQGTPAALATLANVGEELRRLRSIEAAAVAYRDAVLWRRERARALLAGGAAEAREAYQAASDDKRSKGEALFALLPMTGVSTEFVAAQEAQERVAELESKVVIVEAERDESWWDGFDFTIMNVNAHPTTCAYVMASGAPSISQCDCGLYANADRNRKLRQMSKKKK